MAERSTETVVNTAWDDAIQAVGPGLTNKLQEVFMVLTGEGSFGQKGKATPAQVVNGHLARMAVAMNETERRRANPHNAGMSYDPVDILIATSNIGNGREPRADELKTVWFDKTTGRPRTDRVASPEMAAAMAKTIRNMADFVQGRLANPTSLIPARAVSYGDGAVTKALMSDRKEIPRGSLIGTVRLDLPPGFKLGEYLKDHRRSELLALESKGRAHEEEAALADGRAIKFPEGQSVGGVLRQHKISLDTVKKLNPGFDDRKVQPGQFIWIRSPEESPSVRQDAKGGDVGPAEDETIPETGGAPVPQGGPRIVVNPSTFRNEKDALCVAFNEAFRVVMEDMAFEPVSEPTERQRRFFSDTAYADDELQMRRTILARVCTFDTSVQDPTDEQIQEAVEFLTSVMEAGYPENEWEQSAVMRIRDALAEAAGAPAEAPEDTGTLRSGQA